MLISAAKVTQKQKNEELESLVMSLVISLPE